ncbi:MAG: hypothetical protein ABIW80_15265, partial [Lapillicoccus sp.]
MGDHRFAGIPAILLATSERQRAAVEEAFSSRYAHDYDIQVFTSADRLLEAARELTIDQHGIALVAAEPDLDADGTDGAGLAVLDDAHTIAPTARRIALLG